MSTTSIRSTGFSGWSRLAVAGLLLASSAFVYAQTKEEKDKAKKAPPPAQKTEPVQRAAPPAQKAAPPVQRTAPPAERTAPPVQRSNPPTPPQKSITPTPTQTTVHPPATYKGGEAPVKQPTTVNTNQPPVRQPGLVNTNQPPVHQPGTVNTNQPPVRQPGTVNTNQPPVRQPGTVNTNQPPVRQPGTVNTNQPPVRQPGGATPVNGGRMQGAPGGGAGGNGGRNSRPADFHGSNNTQVHYGSNGQPQVVHAKGMTIVHTPSGARQVVVERPDHSVIVTNGARNGYIQRPYVVHNVTYVQRNYYVGGVSYSRVYRPYVYGGISLNVYMPGRYYAPGFYAWAYNPWATPVVYNWGWAGSPWMGFYGGWFTPYPTYTNATFWLTDYVIAMSLQQAYQDRMAAAANAQPYPAGVTPLTPDVKQAIADEVRLQLDEERAAGQNPNAASGAPAFLTDNSAHVFVVSSSLFVMANGGECPVTEGDVLQMTAPPPPGSASVNVVVLASKGQDCRRGSTVSVGITDLADMQSQMRATIDQGLVVLQKGQGGIPAPPPAAQAQPMEAAYAAAAPPPDANVATELTQQAQASTQAESDALNQAQQAAPANSGASTVNISLGMSIDDVVAVMGKPDRIADLGSKKTYFYTSANMKVIFTDGKVTDVQ